MTAGRMEIAPGVEFGAGGFVLIAGPCVVESADLVFETASALRNVCGSLGVPLVFKASYDKANRSSHRSFRSIGFEPAIEALARVRKEAGVPVLTDVHETGQVDAVAEAVDILQIPAFLCRQTDLLQAAARTGRPVNIKRGQFMAPEDMQHAVEKVRAAGNSRVFLTERGVTFGYHNLVVDMRALPIMRGFAPVVFDVTHSVQLPGGLGGASGGERRFAPALARAAAAAGVDGFFVETHPRPDQALSDGPNMIPLAEMPRLLESLLAVTRAVRPYQD
jgi:2-dehydro-3-deoxyphosphooctonate aldolase (KDO 8-P synthase)